MIEQIGKPRGGKTHHPILDLRPAELTVLEPLGEQAHAYSVPEYQLHPVRAFGAEDVDRPVERIGLHDLAHQSRQAFSPLRKSTAFVATITRTAPVGPITWPPSARR